MLSGNYGTSFVLCWQAILLFVTPPSFFFFLHRHPPYVCGSLDTPFHARPRVISLRGRVSRSFYPSSLSLSSLLSLSLCTYLFLLPPSTLLLLFPLVSPSNERSQPTTGDELARLKANRIFINTTPLCPPEVLIVPSIRSMLNFRTP